MKIARFEFNGKVQWGIIEEDYVYRIKGDIFGDFIQSDRLCELKEIQLLSPSNKNKEIACGRNYLGHIEEMGWPIPQEPILFTKPANTICNPREDIPWPHFSTDLRFEAELCVIIKKEAKKVSEKNALEYVLGYTCGNDVTAIDWFIKSDGLDILRTKGFDKAGPLGPWIETDLASDNLSIKSWVNDELRQESNTEEMIFNVPQLIESITEFMTLYPGDVIWTGTPKGGASPVKPGDTIKIEVEGIGILENKIV